MAAHKSPSMSFREGEALKRDIRLEYIDSFRRSGNRWLVTARYHFRRAKAAKAAGEVSEYEIELRHARHAVQQYGVHHSIAQREQDLLDGKSSEGGES